LSARGFRLRHAMGPRDPARFPLEDEALGRSIFALACAGLARGLPRPAFLVLRADQIDQFDLGGLVGAAPPTRERMLAAMAGLEGATSVCLVGALQVRAPGAPAPLRAVAVFLEWPDNRWWTAWQPVSEAGALGTDAPVVRQAVDGWPRPNGVGGWFARARREGLRLRVSPPDAAGETIH
jgi:hypothetical protein